VRHGLRTTEHGRHAAHAVLAAGIPEAVFTSQNLVTVGVVEALHARRLQHRVPMVGFDDLPLADLLKPGITIMAQDPAALGRLAAARLFDRINGDLAPAAVHTVPTRLVVRGSGELVLAR
jgi:LacI family transcriptional regulator